MYFIVSINVLEVAAEVEIALALRAVRFLWASAVRLFSAARDPCGDFAFPSWTVLKSDS